MTISKVGRPSGVLYLQLATEQGMGEGGGAILLCQRAFWNFSQRIRKLPNLVGRVAVAGSRSTTSQSMILHGLSVVSLSGFLMYAVRSGGFNNLQANRKHRVGRLCPGPTF